MKKQTDIRSAIIDLLGQVERQLHSLAFSSGLNPAQWSALRYLAASPDGLRTVTAFARHHRTTKPAASKTVDALVRKALVRKATVPGDRRAQRLDLTAKARGRLALDPRNLLRRVVGGLGAGEAATVARALASIAAGIGHKAAGPAGKGRPKRA